MRSHQRHLLQSILSILCFEQQYYCHLHNHQEILQRLETNSKKQKNSIAKLESQLTVQYRLLSSAEKNGENANVALEAEREEAARKESALHEHVEDLLIA